MYAEEELDVPLIQPLPLKPVFPEDQDPMLNQYPGAVTGHAALMNDLGTGPNHGLLQQAAILLTAGAKTDMFDFHVLDTTLRRGWRIISEVAEQSPVPARQRASAGRGSPRSRLPWRPRSAACQQCRTIPAADAAAISAALSSPGAVAIIALVPGRCKAAAAPARAAPATCGTARTRRRP